MELTPGQLRAARARGCVLTPATDDQVRRLSMQRRIFQVDGLPFVAARDGFFETHGTLAALIEKRRPGATADRGAGADAAPTQAAAPTRAQAAPSGPEASAIAPGAPQAVEERRHGTDALSAKPRKARAPRPKPPPASTVAARTDEAAVPPSEAAEVLAAVEATQGGGPKARVVGRRRAGQPAPPRWTVAGKMRRGRLK